MERINAAVMTKQQQRVESRRSTTASISRTALFWTTFLVLLAVVVKAAQASESQPGLFKCFECSGKNPSCTKSKSCDGKLCLKSYHMQSGSARHYCANFLEPGTPLAGECLMVPDQEVPGQKEQVCACAGHFCNAASRLPSVSVATLTGFAAFAAAFAHFLN
ncbi:hypothetical protein AAVH_28131 [Aphelenchoides avenae]|nr:hypothetical protein AAVH_28131 [Aphelenchus avenae]